MKEKMLLVENPMAYYRISPNQSTNHLIAAMINNMYEYRLRLLENSSHNGFLARLALEDTRLTNIEYFKKTYTSVELPEHIVHEERMNRAKKLLKCRILKKLMRRKKASLSFTSI